MFGNDYSPSLTTQNNTATVSQHAADYVTGLTSSDSIFKMLSTVDGAGYVQTPDLLYNMGDNLRISNSELQYEMYKDLKCNADVKINFCKSAISIDDKVYRYTESAILTSVNGKMQYYKHSSDEYDAIAVAAKNTPDGLPNLILKTEPKTGNEAFYHPDFFCGRFIIRKNKGDLVANIVYLAKEKRLTYSVSGELPDSNANADLFDLNATLAFALSAAKQERR